jgi:hypothetical protein
MEIGDEWRSIIVLKNKEENELRKMRFNNISAVYFGNRMSNKTKSALKKLIQSNRTLSNVHIYEMINEISDYKISAHMIE